MVSWCGKWQCLSLAFSATFLLESGMAWNIALPAPFLATGPVPVLQSRALSASIFSFQSPSRRSVVGMCAAAATEGQQSIPTLADVEMPAARKGDCWRPTADDVDRISWGKPAKKKMTGSRGVPHRLNQEERMLYDMARRKGFIEIGGSGWRKQRRGAPLANTYRSWCDSQGVPVVALHKDKDGQDEVVLDLSPMRVPEDFPGMAAKLAAVEAGAEVEFFEGMAIIPDDSEVETMDGGDGFVMTKEATQDILDGFEKEPIYRLPMFVVSWVVPRAEAKSLAKRLAEKFKTMEPSTKGKKPSKTLQRGMPQIKPGKSRRHGGYGIG